MLHFVAEIHVNGGCFENLLILTNDVTQNNKISSILFSRKMSQNGFKKQGNFCYWSSSPHFKDDHKYK